MKKIMLILSLSLFPLSLKAALPLCLGGATFKTDWSFFWNQFGFDSSGGSCKRKYRTWFGSYCITHGPWAYKFMEPIGVVEITQKKKDLQCLGPLGRVWADNDVRKYQSTRQTGSDPQANTYNIHLFMYPIVPLLGSLFLPTEPGTMRLVYMSEYSSYIPSLSISNSYSYADAKKELLECTLATTNPQHKIRNNNEKTNGCLGSFVNSENKSFLPGHIISGAKQVFKAIRSLLLTSTSATISTPFTNKAKCGPKWTPYKGIQSPYYLQLIKPYETDPFPIGISELQQVMGSLSSAIPTDFSSLKSVYGSKDEMTFILWRQKQASIFAYYNAMTLTPPIISAGSPCHR